MILAIIALIVTPLVLNIVKTAKDSANKRSVDAYGRTIDLAIAKYLLDNADFPTSIDQLTIEYSGSEVVCGVAKLNEDSSVYLSKCSVGGVEVKDSSTDDGWYHYGKTTKVLYQSYKIGDEVTYNGMNFYVIANSDENSDFVTMLKAEPLTVDEVNTYGVGHINRYEFDSVGIANNQNGYGGMAYYTSETCGWVNSSLVETGCTTDYRQSEVKYAVDGWAVDRFQASDLKEDSLGYKVRLITFDELVDNLGYGDNGQGTIQPSKNGNTPEWVYNIDDYWTMSAYEDNSVVVWYIGYNSLGHNVSVNAGYILLRPVVTLYKSAIK